MRQLITPLVFILISFLQSLWGGLLIEVCGIDGCGKSTFIQDLQAELQSRGYKAAILKPLSGDRRVLPFLEDIDAMASSFPSEAFEASVSRFRNDFFMLSFLATKTVIEELLCSHDVVLCDRYLFAARTYQECFGQYDAALESLLAVMPVADCTILIDIPLETALARIGERSQRCAYENAQFLGRARALFHANLFSYRPFQIVEGQGDRSNNVQKALDALERL